MRTLKNLICKECNKEFQTVWNNIFCSRSCSAKFSNKNRPPISDDIKLKRKEGMIKYWQNHPEKRKKPKNYPAFVGSFTQNKYKGRGIKSILNVSKRTASKILKRLNLGCCICQWKEGSCDIHHINGRKIVNPHSHENLTLLCPNHHRLFHEKKISINDVIPLSKYFPENWKDMYYG